MTYDELLDLVDEHDCVIDTKYRSEVHELKLKNIRAVHCLMINSQGKVWIPRRSAHKKTVPLGLDMSVAGCVSSGETYDQAFERELAEELNLKLSEVVWERIGLMTPHEHGFNAFAMFYIIKSDCAPMYNPDEFVGYEWLTPQEILDKIAAGDVSKKDLPTLIRWYFKI